MTVINLNFLFAKKEQIIIIGITAKITGFATIRKGITQDHLGILPFAPSITAKFEIINIKNME